MVTAHISGKMRKHYIRILTGDKVKVGQKIGEAGGFVSAPIHSSARRYRERGWLRTTLRHAQLTLAQAVLSLLVLALTGFVLLFGRYNRMAEPGLHFKLPFGIEKNYNVPTQVVLKQEFGFRTARQDERSRFATQSENTSVSLMLTGDPSKAEAAAAKYYEENVAGRFAVESDSVQFSVTDENKTVTGSGNAYLPTTFLKVAGIDVAGVVVVTTAAATGASQSAEQQGGKRRQQRRERVVATCGCSPRLTLRKLATWSRTTCTAVMRWSPCPPKNCSTARSRGW